MEREIDGYFRLKILGFLVNKTDISSIYSTVHCAMIFSFFKTKKPYCCTVSHRNDIQYTVQYTAETTAVSSSP